MKRALICIVVLAFFGLATAQAALIDCSNLATLQALIDQNVNGGCISQDKIFSSFSYSGGGTQTAANITVHNVAVLVPGQDVHGWSFAPTAGVWTTGFTLSYDITVAPRNPGLVIIQSKDQINSGITTAVSMFDTQTNGPGGSPIGISPVTLLGASVETVFLGGDAETNYPGVTTIHTQSVATIGKSKKGVQGELQSYEQDFYEGLSIPEPAPYFLLAGGLMLLGLASKRVKKA